MPIKVACQCGQRFTAKDAMAGKTVKCPKCTRPLKIPSASAASAATAGKAGLGDLLDEVGLEASQTGLRCPNCGKDIRQGTVLCVNCGFDLRSGKKLQTRKGAPIELDDEDYEPFESHGNPLLDKAELDIQRVKLEQKRLTTSAPWWTFMLGLIALGCFMGYAIYQQPDPIIFGGITAAMVFLFLFLSGMLVAAATLYNAVHGRLFASSEGVPVPSVGQSVGIFCLLIFLLLVTVFPIAFVTATVYGDVNEMESRQVAGAITSPLSIAIFALVLKLMLPTTFLRGLGVVVCYIVVDSVVGGFAYLAKLFVESLL